MLQRFLIAASLLAAAAFATVYQSGSSSSEPKANGAAASRTPAFSDTFSGGKLDTSKWYIDSGRAPGNIDSVNQGTLSPDHVDLSTGMLRLTLTQSVSGALATSVGAEIRSRQRFSYGAYAWVGRAASTSATPNGEGAPASGTVTDFFNFINKSESEIDFEYEGQHPGKLEMTNYFSVANRQHTSTDVTGAESGFHEYKFVWRPEKIEFFVDGTLVSTHTEHIPSAPAAVLVNLWATNSRSFGGIATDSVPRYLYVSSFSYTTLPD